MLVPALLTWQGPFSPNSATSELHPGPPVIQRTTGSVAGSDRDSKNQKKYCVKRARVCGPHVTHTRGVVKVSACVRATRHTRGVVKCGVRRCGGREFPPRLQRTPRNCAKLSQMWLMPRGATGRQRQHSVVAQTGTERVRVFTHILRKSAIAELDVARVLLDGVAEGLCATQPQAR